MTIQFCAPELKRGADEGSSEGEYSDEPMDADDVTAWAKAFAFTEIVEAPLYRFAVPTSWRAGLAASAITHPFVWFAFPWMGERLDLSWTASCVASEIFAWSVEALFFRRLCRISWARAALVSLVANGASLGLGLFVRRTIGIV